MTHPNTDSETLEAVFAIPFPHGVSVFLWEEWQAGRKEKGFQLRLSPQEVVVTLGKSLPTSLWLSFLTSRTKGWSWIICAKYFPV